LDAKRKKTEPKERKTVNPPGAISQGLPPPNPRARKAKTCHPEESKDLSDKEGR